MRFRALPVTSLEDVTVDLEQLSTRNVLDQTIAFGQTTCVGGLSVAISHGLGAVPVAFGGTAGRSGGAIPAPIVDANQDPTSTTLTLAVTQLSGSGSTYKLWWWAIA